MKTPIFTRSGEFKIANRISSFCLKTVDFDPVPVHCTGPGFPDPFQSNGDHRHGNKWRKWRVFNSHWTATMIAGVSNGNIHVHFLILRIEPLDNVSKVVIWITWPKISQISVLQWITWPLNWPIKIVFNQNHQNRK